MDFSKSLMHCSIIAFLMSEGREKTPYQIWEDCAADLEKWRQKYEAMTDRLKGMANGLKAQKKIEELTEKEALLSLSKDEQPLSATAKSYLKKYYAFLKYGKWSASLDKGNKYTNKGKLGEQASIELVSFLDDQQYRKNEVRLTNEYLTGEPDVIHIVNEGADLYIIDVKSSWDIETFMDNLGKDLNPLYWWQLMAYFALTGASSGEVSYCLVDTPEVILNQEKNWLFSRMNAATNLNPEYMEAERVLISNMTFSDIPQKDRRIKFTVERDEEAIAKMYKRIEKAREYLAEIQELHAIGTFKAKSIGNEETVEEAA